MLPTSPKPTTERPPVLVKTLYFDKRVVLAGQFDDPIEAKRLAVRLLNTDRDIRRTKVVRGRVRLAEYRRNFLGRVRQI